MKNWRPSRYGAETDMMRLTEEDLDQLHFVDEPERKTEVSGAIHAGHNQGVK